MNQLVPLRPQPGTRKRLQDLNNGVTKIRLPNFRDGRDDLDIWLTRGKCESSRPCGGCYMPPLTLIPMLLWVFLVYEITTSSVEMMEVKINRFKRKRLGIPPGLTDVAMYNRKAKLRLNLKSILAEYKCGRARLMTMGEDSEDLAVRSIQSPL
ncbi:reverse transcriptase [Plakobranchus ocellatus]|uniref:Reverse transcriptase n=1 Tax=Plakobranchus ocellatus TaxID=259542 RepID=A0AAV3ZCR0_9GAST|nr:reverse transcriptase [Plakobranchus ocellatus]